MDPILVALEGESASVVAGDQNGIEEECVKVGLRESKQSLELAVESVCVALASVSLLRG